MATYHLQIVTPDALCFDGQAEKLIVRTTTGDVCILAHHINYVTALGMGEARIGVEGKERRAACIGGMLTVHEGEVKLVASTFEWAENINAARAARSEAAARETLEQKELTPQDRAIAEARLKRALVRQGVAEKK